MLDAKLLNFINVKVVPYIKKNQLILNISLDVRILLLDVATVNHLQHIYHVCCLPTGCNCMFFASEQSPCTFINVLTSNHTIKLVNTGTSTCYSTLNRPVARKFCWGVLLKKMWAFSYCSLLANHSPGAVDELIFMVCGQPTFMRACKPIN